MAGKYKEKPRGKPFLKGADPRREGNGRPTKARETAKTFSECFINLMNKEVAATEGGQAVLKPNYEHFLSEMIKAGIKGAAGTPARKLVLDFMGSLEAKEEVADGKQAAEGEEFGADFPRQGPKSVRT